MIILKNVERHDGQQADLHIKSDDSVEINAEGLLALPAVIDPHVHFRTPGMEHKEDWLTGARAAIRGGCTTVFDMPNTIPPSISRDLLLEKKQLIDSQLKAVDIPLRYELYLGADKNHLAEISQSRSEVVGIKVFMGCSTGNLVIDDDESLHAVFSIAAKENVLVAVHAEDEHLIRQRQTNYPGPQPFSTHSEIRNIEVATRAVEKAIHLAKHYKTKLYILHVSSADEVALIKAAKKECDHIYAETTPHHLFFNDSLYERLGGCAQVNPPLRNQSHQEALFAAIRDQVIDTIGSDHAPHTLAEKAQPYGICPSGMPGIEFMLPLLLNSYHNSRLRLEEVVALTSKRAREIFSLPLSSDWVLVDLRKVQTITDTKSKCGWTPYQGLTLKGWPVMTILRGKCYHL